MVKTVAATLTAVRTNLLDPTILGTLSDDHLPMEPAVSKLDNILAICSFSASTASIIAPGIKG